VVEFEVRLAADVGCQQGGVSQTGAGILGGEAGDVQRRLDGLANGLGREVGGVGVSLALAEVDRHRDALVPVVLDGFDLAAAHAHRLPETRRHIDLASARSLLGSVGEDIARQLPQRVEAVTEA
jgi:hypothetical protein